MIRHLIEEGSPLEIIATLIAFGLIVASILSLVYIIIGGISFILSAGNEEKAVHTVRYSIIGLAVSFIAFFAVSWIAKLLEIPFDLSFGMVIDLMNSIFEALK